MLDYHEIRPPPALTCTVECFWTMRHEGEGTLHRVLPDGCMDMLLTCRHGAATLDAVGPMTRYRDHDVARGFLLGVRFRPGGGSRALGLPPAPLLDVTVPLEGPLRAPARR